jgi:hypothetical protein
VARTVKINVCSVLVGKGTGKRLFGKNGREWEDDIEVVHKRNMTMVVECLSGAEQEQENCFGNFLKFLSSIKCEKHIV